MTVVRSVPVAATARLVGEHDADLWVLWERRVARSGLTGSGREAPRVRSSAQGRRSEEWWALFAMEMGQRRACVQRNNATPAP